MKLLKVYLFAIFSMALSCFAQTIPKGIHFQNTFSWSDVLAKARSSNMPIFIDCYATWCGPCKYMDKQIFSNEEVGDFFNKNFVCVRVQMDHTEADDSVTRSWYKDAERLINEFGIVSYPSYLFFDVQGKPIHRITGAVKQPSEFVVCGRQALDTSVQYFTSLQKIRNGGLLDSSQLMKLYNTAVSVSDINSQALIGINYLQHVKEFFNKNNIPMLAAVRIALKRANNDKSFRDSTKLFLINNAEKINAVMADPKWVQRQLSEELYYDNVTVHFVANEFPIDWQAILDSLPAKYPSLAGSIDGLKSYFNRALADAVIVDVKTLAERYQKEDIDWAAIRSQVAKKVQNSPELEKLILSSEVLYCRTYKLWKDGLRLSIELLNKFNGQTYAEPNQLLWQFVFLHNEDKQILKWAIKKQKEWIEGKGVQDYNGLDTYANLLYKAGRKEAALKWEQKAVEVAKIKNAFSSDMDEFAQTIQKMKDGKPTWTDREE